MAHRAKSSAEQTLAAMIEFGRRAAADSRRLPRLRPSPGNHPRLGRRHPAIADAVVSAAGLAEPMPRLAQLVAASPLEAAIHDAYGKALGQNSYNLLGTEYVDRDMGGYLTSDFAGEYLDHYTLRQPKPTMPLYHLIGALDPLTEADIATPHQRRAARDAARVDRRRRTDTSEDQAQRRQPGVGRRPRGGHRADGGRGPGRPRLRSNGAIRPTSTRSAPTCEYVLDFLAQVGERAPGALRRLQYIEQPTHRDLRANPENRMHRGRKDQARGDRRIAGRLRERCC